MNDPVNHPAHYNQGEIEFIDAMESCLTPEQFQAACRFNNMKYGWRAGRKDDPVQDLNKQKWYLNREIQSRERAKGGAPTEESA